MTPRITARGATDPRGVVLLLHGGEEENRRRAHRLRPAYVRMVPFARDLGRTAGLGVWLLCNTYRGWNKPDLPPVADARWALERLRRTHPGVPVVLVGHSMGGRVALRVADDPAVVGVCALAPWTTENDHVAQLAGRSVLIAHGDRDTMTTPADSLAYAARAREVTDVCRFDVRGEGHAMLRRYRTWSRLVRDYVLGTLGITELDGAIAEALRIRGSDGLTVPL